MFCSGIKKLVESCIKVTIFISDQELHAMIRS